MVKGTNPYGCHYVRMVKGSESFLMKGVSIEWLSRLEWAMPAQF